MTRQLYEIQRRCQRLNFPDGKGSIHYYAPSPDLRNCVKYYWFVNAKKPGHVEDAVHVSPSGFPELIFHFGDSVEIHTGMSAKPRLVSDALIAGQITKPVKIQLNHHLNCICVKLQPYALPLLFNAGSNEFTDRVTLLSDLLPVASSHIYEQLSEAPDDVSRIATIENVLNKIFDKRKCNDFYFAKAVIDCLKSNECCRIHELEDRFGLSVRSIQRRIKEDIGMSPSNLMRIIRFNKAYQKLQTGASNKLQDIAFELGYYDLSHFVNEFREFTGNSPLRYQKSKGTYNDLFAGIL